MAHPVMWMASVKENVFSNAHSVIITAGPVAFSIHANSINVAMHYNSEVRFLFFFLLRADCVMRNASFKLKFQGRKFEEPFQP